MVKRIDPHETNRALAFELWMKAPMPMVTLFKTLNVTRLVKLNRRRQLKFNLLMCWCIGKAASQTEEFYLLPVGEHLYAYEKIAVNTVVSTKNGEISTCDIPFSDDFRQFQKDYLRLTAQVHNTCKAYDLGDDYMVIGTSALAAYEIDGAVDIYAGFYNNPFLIWGKYRKKLLKATLPVSFQFHHTQMDGAPAARFLECLQTEINRLEL